jgi:hypothetical protein
MRLYKQLLQGRTGMFPAFNNKGMLERAWAEGYLSLTNPSLWQFKSKEKEIKLSIAGHFNCNQTNGAITDVYKVKLCAYHCGDRCQRNTFGRSTHSNFVA